jgi:hypothetical protein
LFDVRSSIRRGERDFVFAPFLISGTGLNLSVISSRVDEALTLRWIVGISKKNTDFAWILPSFFTLLITTHSTSHSIALQEHCLDIIIIIIITIITSYSLNNNNKINRCVSVFRSPLISIVTGFSQLLYRMRKDRSIFSASLCRVSFFSVLSTA